MLKEDEFMDLGIIISLFIAFASLVAAFLFEGGALSSLLQPTAALIVFGGTIGVVGASFPTKQLLRLPKILGVAFKGKMDDKQDLINTIVRLSTMTRQNGLLALEAEISKGGFSQFLAQGLQMVLDGTEPEKLKDALESKIENISERHEQGAAIFEAAGGYGPTLGIIGTVLGLVQVLGNLSNPDELGPKIAVAFIATLYGVASANLLWLPIANRLKGLNSEETITNIMILDGVTMMQQGDNPRIIEEKLRGYLENEAKKEKEI